MQRTSRVKTPLFHQHLASVERFRQAIAFAITALFFGWVIFGLIMVVSKGNVWLLVSAILLAYPFYLVMHYYFSK